MRARARPCRRVRRACAPAGSPACGPSACGRRPQGRASASRRPRRGRASHASAITAFGGRVPRVRGDDHLVAVADPGTDQAADERRRARVDAERVAGAHVLGELALEVEHLVRARRRRRSSGRLLGPLSTRVAASISSAPISMPPGNIGGSGRVRAGGPPSRASRMSRCVSVTRSILDMGPSGRNPGRLAVAAGRRWCTSDATGLP